LVKKSTILVSDADNSGDYAYVGTGGLGEIPVLSSQFCCQPEIALKN